jgi:hypothetical protein
MRMFVAAASSRRSLVRRLGTSDLLRDIGLASHLPLRLGSGGVLNKRLMPAMKCRMGFFVDGVAIPVRDPDTDFPLPHEIAGIEHLDETLIR